MLSAPITDTSPFQIGTRFRLCPGPSRSRCLPLLYENAIRSPHLGFDGSALCCPPRLRILLPFRSEHDFAYVQDHPVADAYRSYMKMPYDRPTWDLTAVLYAVRPDYGYFSLSDRNTISLMSRTIP